MESANRRPVSNARPDPSTGRFGAGISDAPLESAIDLNPAAALLCRADDLVIIHANSRAAKSLGVDVSDLSGRVLTEFCANGRQAADLKVRLSNSSEPSDWVAAVRLPDGREKWLNCAHRVVEHEGGRAVYTVLADVTEIMAAEAEAEAAARVTSALADISSVMASSRPGVPVYEGIATIIGDLIPFDRIGMALLDPSEDTFELVFVRGTGVRGREQGTTHAVDNSLNSYVTRERRGLILNADDTSELNDRFPSVKSNIEAGLKSFLTAPMVADDRIVGTISVRSATAHAYSNRDLDVFERIASLMAPALEQARLYTDLETEARDRQIIADIGRVISSSPDVGSVYPRFTQLARQIIPADRVAITSVEEDGEQFRILHYAGTDTPGRGEGQVLPIEGSVVRDVARFRGPVLLHAVDREQMAREYSTLLPLYDAGLRSFLSLPLFVADRTAGSIHFFSRVEEEYTQRHILLAESVASQIAGVIATSQLRAAEQATARENAALAEIGRIINSSLDTRDIFESFARRVTEVLPCDRLVITTLNEEEGVATDAFVFGDDVPGWGHGTVHPIAGSPFQEVLKTRRTSVMADIPERSDNDGAVEALMKSGLRSSIMVPLFSNGEVLGTLNLKCKAAGAYSAKNVELAERIADQIAGAIANSLLYGDVQSAADKRRALAKIGLAATQDLDLDGVFARTAAVLKEVVTYDRMSITLFDDDGESLRVAFTTGEPLGQYREGVTVIPAPGDPHSDGIWVFESGQTTAERPDGKLSEIVHAPLGSRKRHLGYIRLRSSNPGAYDSHSVELLEQVATHLTPAIQNALEHRQAMRLAEERERSLVLDHENQELQRLNEAKSRFLSTVSHELKTPLTSISAFTDILLKNRQGGMTEKDLTQLTVVQRNNRRLGSLIDDLLDLSRLDRDSLQLATSQFEVAELVNEVVDGFQPIADTKAQTIVRSISRRPVWLTADRDRLVQVLTNLLSNASKYSPANSNIKIATRRWKDRLYFSVSDRGIGISKEDQESLFTLFFRADNESTRAEAGTGIGLYIAQSIVELHGGKIGIKSEVNAGTTVNFYIPGATSTEPKKKPRSRVRPFAPWSRLETIPNDSRPATAVAANARAKSA